MLPNSWIELKHKQIQQTSNFNQITSIIVSVVYLHNVHSCSYIMARTSFIRWTIDDSRFVLDQYALLDCYTVS